MDKFLRNYSLRVQTNNPTRDFLTIRPPFTLEFDITRNELTSANLSKIRIYNLSQKNRNLILKDVINTDDIRLVTLQAGYGLGDSFPVIFAGYINQCFSVREGDNFITEIDSFDGGYAFVNSQFSREFKSGTAYRSIVDDIASSLGPFGVSKGAIGEVEGEISRDKSYTGSPIDIISSLTNGGIFIDCNKINCIGKSECVGTPTIPVINSKSGLLGTPLREQTILHFDVLFEPTLIVGQQIKLDSRTAGNYNGFYKIISIQHKGTISEAVCGDAVTTLGVFFGTRALTPIFPEVA